MQIKLIPERGLNGIVDTFAYLADDIQEESECDCTERTVYNLGSIGNGGLEKLIELSNSINHLFLESALENHRDSIVCSRSYGIVYLINQMLNKWDVSSELIIGSGDPNSHELYELLPSVLATLLDYDTKYNFTLDDLLRRIYIPKDICFNASTIRNLIQSIQIIPGDPFKAMSINHPYQNEERHIRELFTEKLNAWATSDCGSWYDFRDAEGMERIVSLAEFLHDSVAEQTAMPWRVINEHLSELQAIRVESGAKTFLLTTRPTSMQLNILYRLKLQPPLLVIIEQGDQLVAIESKIESNTYEDIDLIHDPFFEAIAPNISN